MIDEQIRDRPVREYLDETNDALNDFDLALENVRSGASAAFFVLPVQGRGLETIFLDITLHRMCEYLYGLQIAK